jgi:hypothetical protein
MKLTGGTKKDWTFAAIGTGLGTLAIASQQFKPEEGGPGMKILRIAMPVGFIISLSKILT